VTNEDAAINRVMELLGRTNRSGEEQRELDGLLSTPITVPGVGVVPMGQMTIEQWRSKAAGCVAALDQVQAELRDLEALFWNI
jgi:hypothetical protein